VTGYSGSGGTHHIAHLISDALEPSLNGLNLCHHLGEFVPDDRLREQRLAEYISLRGPSETDQSASSTQCKTGPHFMHSSTIARELRALAQHITQLQTGHFLPQPVCCIAYRSC